jgi:hypothetical protein
MYTMNKPDESVMKTSQGEYFDEGINWTGPVFAFRNPPELRSERGQLPIAT